MVQAVWKYVRRTNRWDKLGHATKDLRSELGSQKLRIEITDEGDGFDPDHLPDPLSPEGLLRGSGRGVYLARAFMDEFHVRREPVGWTTVIMAKLIHSAT